MPYFGYGCVSCHILEERNVQFQNFRTKIWLKEQPFRKCFWQSNWSIPKLSQMSKLSTFKLLHTFLVSPSFFFQKSHFFWKISLLSIDWDKFILPYFDKSWNDLLFKFRWKWSHNMNHACGIFLQVNHLVFHLTIAGCSLETIPLLIKLPLSLLSLSFSVQ